MLVENAIKHNIISKEHKLSVNIYEEQGFIYVVNNLQEKKTMEKSSGVGLNNIISRYKFLTENEVSVSNEGETFSVKIPLLKIDG